MVFYCCACTEQIQIRIWTPFRYARQQLVYALAISDIALPNHPDLHKSTGKAKTKNATLHSDCKIWAIQMLDFARNMVQFFVISFENFRRNLLTNLAWFGGSGFHKQEDFERVC